MDFYLQWSKSEGKIHSRKKYLFHQVIKSSIVTKGLCWSCQIFDHANQKCTHPELGCDTNKARIKPWENEIICPKKIKF